MHGRAQPGALLLLFLLGIVFANTSGRQLSRSPTGVTESGEPGAEDGRRSLQQVALAPCNSFHVESYPGLLDERGCEAHCTDVGTDACLAYAFDPVTGVCFLKLACGKKGWEPSRFPSLEDMLVPIETDKPMVLPPSVEGGGFRWDWPTGPGWAPLPPASPPPVAQQPPPSAPLPVPDAPTAAPLTPSRPVVIDPAEQQEAQPEVVIEFKRRRLCRDRTYQAVSDGNQAKCEARCLSDPNCGAFVLNTDTKMCYMKETCLAEVAGKSVHFIGIKVAPTEVSSNNEGKVATESGGGGTGSWGSSIDFAAQCRDSSGAESYYFCNADCAANCAASGQGNGLLVPQLLSGELQYCESQHSKVEYDDSACCCGRQLGGLELRTTVVPCLPAVPVPSACDAFCRLHSAPLGVGSKADCAPGRSWCFPFGLVATDPTCSPIECSQQQCCCRS